MAKAYTEIQKQIADLQAKAEAIRVEEVRGVITRIKAAIATYGITAADLGLGRGPGRPKKAVAASTPVRKRASKLKGKKLGKVPVKYRDKAGSTWTGRGNQPVWLREAIRGGAKLESFLV